MTNINLGQVLTAGLLGVSLFLGSAQSVLADRRSVSPGVAVTLSGTSGGSSNSRDCGWIAESPNHVLDVTQDLPYWSITVQTAGAPTLLIDGPAGRYCVLPESPSGSMLQFSGYGTRGTYRIFIGDRQQSQHPYSLSISDRKP
ncbi:MULTISPECIES: hypothetical protein [Limnospira]|jgi:hypothetical protein|uniref:Uncharacterized protein n=1 Tax=Limnospira platensis NIES-46 TaxID=1236695 RepID=A0A5M3T0X5_LIMPL|nr:MULTISPECIES: hypothetical protein [Arthrospira]AMW29540.1 hypothetical protein AP285_18040 [Arthrospira platensis YZ]KDR56951.1 hypothetical protein APPUASWS_013785 [Arthrospira platensis str. Paraca]MBD2669026.1 hypothetical protein [Arthrospira platensis FACHB-439]MBD2709565.1 hypothetical protein [Arthrospira platensis FACHB-835]MDF2212519.1 hypothetical protein [Arthrospira platensis NCB002]MDT9181519.1 hypothetical protein [Limnospira sp. PMC 289.06]MDT9294053.1 hypothetical protein